MPVDYTDDNGDRVKHCIGCKETHLVKEFYEHSNGIGYKPRCRTCNKAELRELNARRAKKRRQSSHKLTKRHVDWIREQQGKLSTREVAKKFSKRFFNMKLNSSTVSRIYSGKIHKEPGTEDTMSIYDLLEAASDFSGSVEQYIESTDLKKIKF